MYEGRSEGPGPQASAGKLGAGAIASIAGLTLLAIFMIQNREDVQLDFLFWHFTWKVWVLTIVSAVLGAFVWFGLGVIRRHRRRKDRRDDRRN